MSYNVSIGQSLIVNLGFYNEDTANMYLMHTDEEKNFWKLNIINAAGYIPVIGIFVGILRNIMSSETIYRGHGVIAFKKPLSERVISYIRGSCEILGVGLLFLIPDLIATIGRSIHYSSKSDKNYTTVVSSYRQAETRNQYRGSYT